jgi:formylglycine-generating enzyme required for sulfatase activity
MNRAILGPIFILALFYSLFQAGFAQLESRSAPADEAKQTNCSSTTISSMVLVRGGTVQIGIDATQIPSFQKIFDIDSPQLFQDEVPKHWVTLDEFYIDECPVTNAQFKSFTDANPEWQPDRIPRELDNGNYLKHWKKPGALTANILQTDMGCSTWPAMCGNSSRTNGNPTPPPRRKTRLPVEICSWMGRHFSM